MKKKIRPSMLGIIALASMAIISITLSKYISTLNKTITLNVRKPEYTVNFYRNVLPDEYQEVEYIESTGTQYIDTGYTNNTPKTGYYIKYQNSKNHSGDDVIMGVLNPNRCLGVRSLKAVTYWKEAGTGFDGSTSVPILQSDIVEAWLNYKNNNKRQININEEMSTLEDVSNVTTTNNLPCLIFGASYGNTVYGRSNGLRVFSAKISENNKLVRDFIPCYRKSDSVIGLYDIVNDVFYTNQGTGTFIVGPDVNTNSSVFGTMPIQQFTYGTAQNLLANTYEREGYNFTGWNTKADGTGTSYTDEQEVINLSSIDGDVIELYAQWKVNEYDVVFKRNGLPEGYQEVEYIESTGTQWLDAGLDGVSKTVQIQSKFSISQQKSYQCLFCCREGINSATRTLFFTGTSWLRNDQAGQKRSINAGGFINQIKTLDSSQTEFRLDDNVLITYNNDTGDNINSKFTILDSYDDNKNMSDQYGFVGKLYYFKIYDNNDLVRNMIPCYRKSDGEIGLYDIVNDVFYTNQGTGTFIAGPDVNTNSNVFGIMPTQHFTYGIAQNLTANTYTREGYTFTGWNTRADGTGTSYTDGQEVINLSSIDGDVIELYAQWTANGYEVKYYPNFGELPEEYQEVEYIESSGTQYIDTHVMPSENFKATISFKTKEILSEQYILGCAGGSNNRFYLVTNNFDIGYMEYKHATISFDTNTEYHTVCTYTNGNQIIECNGKIINNADFTVSGKWNNSIKMFARDGSQRFGANVLLYYCKLEQEGTVVREYIPCYRKLDNKVGMYDLVESRFYTNDGSGDFSKGNDVPVQDSLYNHLIATQQFTYGTAQNLTANTYTREGYTFTGWNTKSNGSGTSYADEEEVLNLSSIDGDVINLYAQWRPNTYTVNFNNNRLPEEYQEVEYIQSTGTQFIDLGLAPKKDLIIESKINPQAKSGAIYIGVMGDNDNTDYRFFYTQGNLYFDINAGRAQVRAAESEILNNIFTVELGNYYIKKDGETVISRTPTDSEPDISKNLCIFGGYFGTSMAYSKLRAYTLKIWDEGKLVRDFVPCYRKSDGAIGMYDLVANTFYTNNGTGTFDKGQDIKDTQQFTYGKEQNLKANTFTREGYTFAGWNTKPDGSGTSYEDEEEVLNLSSTDGDVINLYAQWTASTYTVTLNPGTDGTLPGKTQGQTDTTSVTYNSTYGTLPAPTREGYTFDGWFTAETGGDKIESSTTVTTAANNQTLWAHWTEKMQGLYIGETSITTLDLDGAILLSAVSTDTPSLTTNSSYTWESSNRNIADVTTEGIVKCSTNTSSDLGGTTAVITCKNSSGVIVGQVTVTSTSKILNTTTNTTTENINKNRRISGSEAYNNPTIPAGYQAINTNDATWTTEETQTNVNNGLTIMDNRGNQFVWVPVPNAIYDATDATNNGGMLTSYTPVANMAGTYTPMAIQIGTNYKSLPYEYNEAKGIRLYYPTGTNYQGTTNPYKEPDVLSSTGNGDWSTKANRGLNLIVKHINEYKTKKVGTDNNAIKEGWTNQLIGEYDDMIRQVSSYEGFWVGRYEESWDDSQNKIAVIAGARSANGDHDNTQTWYGLYQKPKDYGENNSYYASSMIYGSQYDAMMNWMAKNGNNVIKANDDNRNRTRITGNPTTTYSNNDKINNIMDIYGNSQEWTQEAWGTADRAYRGGTYSISRRPGYRYTNYTYQANTNYGSRPALCLK